MNIPKDQQERNRLAKERLQAYYSEPASPECIENRNTILQCFTKYQDEWVKMWGAQYDRIETEVMAAAGIPFRTRKYILFKGMEIIDELPLKATQGILMSERLSIYDHYEGEDKHEYCIAASIIDIFQTGKMYFAPYKKELHEKELERIKAAATLETEEDKARFEVIIERETKRYEEMLTYQADTIDYAYQLWIGERWLGVFNFDDERMELQRFEEFISPLKEKTLEVISNLNKPETYSILNNKVSNQYASIQDKLLATEPNGQLTFMTDLIPVMQSPRAAKKKSVEVNTLVGLSYSGELSRKLARVNGYDKAVLNTVCSIFQAGNQTMTLADIFRVMNGNTSKQPSQKQRDKILSSIKKLGATRIYLNISEEIERKYLTINDSRVTKGIIDEPLLHYTVGLFQTENGQEVYAVSILKEPILMTYSKAKSQLVSFPISLLDTKSVSATDDIVAIREYLLQQITLMRNGQRDNKTILYESIYKSCGIDAPTDRKTAMRKRDSIDKLLEEWKQQDYIKGYKVKKSGTSFVGFEIKT